MKKNTGVKALSCAVGICAVLGGTASVTLGPLQGSESGDVAVASEAQAPVTVQKRAAVEYNKVANVAGEFSFTQDELTPADEVFNLFGTAATSVCSKPGFAFDDVDRQDYFINVGGNVKKVYSVSLDELEDMDSTTLNMRCTCGMGGPIAMAQVKGVRVADMLSMTDIDPEVNTITFKDDSGYGLPLPLSYVTEKDALLVYQIGDKKLSGNTPVQVWIPDTIAQYFTRRVTDIELSVSDSEPAVKGPDAQYRAKVNILNTLNDTFAVGDQISFEGYADDCGVPVTAVEFSLDNGETWTTFDTSSANSQDWVYWHFDYTANQAGIFKLDVRAVTEDGVVSPLASSVVFTVEE